MTNSFSGFSRKTATAQDAAQAGDKEGWGRGEGEAVVTGAAAALHIA